MEYPTIEAIDQALTEKIPELKRRKATRRIFDELGINYLLDQRNEQVEAIEAFESSFNIGVE